MNVAVRVLILVVVVPCSSFYEFLKRVLCDRAKTYLSILLLSF